MQDGIFSVSALLKEYPDYDGFVAQAFLPQPSPAKYDVVSCENWPLALDGKQLHVWHSRDDELLSFKQSLDIILHLDSKLSTAASASIPVVIPQDGNASTTEVHGEKKLLASLYADTSIKNASQLHADLTTLRVSVLRPCSMRQFPRLTVLLATRRIRARTMIFCTQRPSGTSSWRYER